MDEEKVLRTFCKERHEQGEKLCDEKHKPIDKDLKDHESWLNCIDKKLRDKAEKKDLDKKADIGEVNNLKNWVSKVDGRMWAVLIGMLLTLLSTAGTFLMLVLKKGG